MSVFGLGMRRRGDTGGYRDLMAAMQLFEPEIRQKRVTKLNQGIMKAFSSKDPGEPLSPADLQRIVQENPNVNPKEIMEHFKAASQFRKRNYYYGLGQKLQETMKAWQGQGKKPNKQMLQEFFNTNKVGMTAQAEFSQILEQGVQGGAFKPVKEQIFGSAGAGYHLYEGKDSEGKPKVSSLVTPNDDTDAKTPKPQTIKIGDEFVNIEWAGKDHKEKGIPKGYTKISTADRYKPQTIINMAEDTVLKRELMGKGRNTFNLIRLGDFVKSNVSADTSATLLGTTGKAQRLIDSVSKQLVAIAKKVGGQAVINGKEVPDNALFNPKLYDFSGLGEASKSAKIRSALVQMAYILARTREKGGRLSVDDVQLAMESLGAKTGSPEQLRETLDFVVQSSIQEYNDFAVQMGSPGISKYGRDRKTKKLVVKMNDNTNRFIE